MNERTEQSAAQPGGAVAQTTFGRREMLRRTGFVVGATALWTTPIVQTIGMRPAAATLGEPLCVDAEDGSFECHGSNKPTAIGFSLVNSWIYDEDNLYSAAFPAANESSGCEAEPKWELIGEGKGQQVNDGDPNDLVSVEYFDGQLDSPNIDKYGDHLFADSTSFSFNLSGSGAWTTLAFKDSDGKIIMRVSIHTSCSQYLACGDRFAFVRVSSATNASGGTVTC